MDMCREDSSKKVNLRLTGNLVSNEKVVREHSTTGTFRTYNRSRSLSFLNSDQLENVNKGSRQIKPVTSGKGLALMVGLWG